MSEDAIIPTPLATQVSWSERDASVPQVVGLPAVDNGEGCPQPLAWKQVRSEFLKQSQEFHFAIDGLSLSGRVMGEGTPLYFLNGISASSTLFCLTAWLLREEFRCVILDYPSEAQTFDQLVKAFDITATRLGDEQFDLYATSFGSAVALLAMHSYPQRIQRAVLQGPLISMQFTFAERVALGMLGWLPGPIQRLPFRNTVLQNNHRLWFPPFDITRWEFLLRETGVVPIRDVARRAKMLRTFDISSSLTTLATPSLIISCEGEAARHRDAARLLGERLPHAEVEELSNSGHVPFVTHPHRLVKLIRPFLHPEQPAENCSLR
ncbi:MAG: alpha/beta hydrolase [Planctomycetota bacterium]|nr:alpha/beta hydrolase [Planctomycetota bacterium]